MAVQINIPNQITLARLGLAIVFVALLSWFDANELERQATLVQVCFWIYLVAALGDILDGYLARSMNAVTAFGRVLDPVVDKVLVCGAFILFASSSFVADGENITGVRPWMVVVIVARELLVSAVRSHAESGGEAFGAAWSGKLKMFVQSATICIILGEFAWDIAALTPVRLVGVWFTVLITAASMAFYLHRARAFLLSAAALGGASAGTPDHDPPDQQNARGSA